MGEASEPSPNNIDRMTITFLTNPSSKAKLDSMNFHHNEDKFRQKELRTDIRFYRKRLINVVKCLITNKDIPKEVTSSSIHAWNILAKQLINDFRVLDIHDTIQEELCDVALIDSSNMKACSARESQVLVDRANKEIMATRTIPVTLDKFVIKKTYRTASIMAVQFAKNKTPRDNRQSDERRVTD